MDVASLAEAGYVMSLYDTEVIARQLLSPVFVSEQRDAQPEISAIQSSWADAIDSEQECGSIKHYNSERRQYESENPMKRAI
jgi:hypothetical protein